MALQGDVHLEQAECFVEVLVADCHRESHAFKTERAKIIQSGALDDLRVGVATANARELKIVPTLIQIPPELLGE